jgi:hypothetical protein
MFLTDQLGLSGLLLGIETRDDTATVPGAGFIFGYRIEVPNGRVTADELSFILDHTPGAVAGVTGERGKGNEWIVVLQYWPEAGSSAGTAFGRALVRAGGYQVLGSFSRSIDQIRDYYRNAVASSPTSKKDRAALSIVPKSGDVTFEVRGLITELVGYATPELVRNSLRACAFPNTTHTCSHDTVEDVIAAWNCGRLRWLIECEAIYPAEWRV